MMRLSGLALMILALQHAPVSAQALPLTEAMVVGAWEFSSEELSRDPGTGDEFRLAGFFTGERTYESILWRKDGGAADSRNAYTGIRVMGTWFIRGTLLGLIPSTCQGFTEPGNRECGIEADELGDTDYVTLEDMDLPAGRYKVMRTQGDLRLPLWRYDGLARDMEAPSFWAGSPVSLADRLPLTEAMEPGSGIATPVFDVLGRKRTLQDPLRLHRHEPAGRLRASR